MRARRLCVHSVPSRIAKSIHVRPGPANGTAKGFRESAERKGRSGVLLPWGADHRQPPATDRNSLGADDHPPELLVATAHERFDRELQLRHESTRRVLAALLERFARWIDRERVADAAERALASPASAHR